MKRIASCSDAQQLAEKLMVSEFSRQLGRDLAKATIPIGKAKVAVDGFHKGNDCVTLVEAWAHVGSAKSAQRNKVLGDILKLALVTAALKRSSPTLKVESYIVFADSPAANVLNGRGWASLAANEFGITARILLLPDEVVETIKEAQRKQDIRITDDCDAETA